MDLEHTPALASPPGVLPNFISPESQANIFVTTSSVFLAVMLLIFVMRMYANVWVKHKFRADDGRYYRVNSRIRLTSFTVACILSTVIPPMLVRLLGNDKNRRVLYAIHRRSSLVSSHGKG